MKKIPIPENVTAGISVVLLAYKEAENLKFLLPRIKGEVEKLGEPYEILVIDTAEPLDNTEEICEVSGAVYINQEESEFGGAFRTAIKYASKRKFLIMDSDGSHNPKYIPEIYKLFIEGYDIVIGSRYCRGGRNNDAFPSVLMSRTLNFVFRVCLGEKICDMSTDFRMYDTVQLKAVELRNKNYDVLQEVLLKMRLNNPALKIGETPIVFEKRLAGISKRRLIPFIIKYLKSLVVLTAISLAAKFRKRKK